MAMLWVSKELRTCKKCNKHRYVIITACAAHDLSNGMCEEAECKKTCREQSFCKFCYKIGTMEWPPRRVSCCRGLRIAEFGLGIVPRDLECYEVGG